MENGSERLGFRKVAERTQALIGRDSASLAARAHKEHKDEDAEPKRPGNR